MLISDFLKSLVQQTLIIAINLWKRLTWSQDQKIQKIGYKE